MTNTAACLSFIESQMQQIQYTATTASTIQPAQTWLPSYTGPVSGTFTLDGVSYGTEQLCPITITSPAGAVANSYRGTVKGHAGTAYAGYTVLAFLNVNGTENIVAPQAAVNSNGTFSLNLSSVLAGAPGSWNFALQNPETFAWPVGAYWPSPPMYVNLEVQSWVITNTATLAASQPAAADNAFAFPASQPGRKMFILYDTSADANIAVYVPITGNVRSYLVTEGQPGYGTSFIYQSFLYDQAMCLIAAIAEGQPAISKQLVYGLLQFQAAVRRVHLQRPAAQPRLRRSGLPDRRACDRHVRTARVHGGLPGRQQPELRGRRAQRARLAADAAGGIWRTGGPVPGRIGDHLVRHGAPVRHMARIREGVDRSPAG